MRESGGMKVGFMFEDVDKRGGFREVGMLVMRGHNRCDWLEGEDRRKIS